MVFIIVPFVWGLLTSQPRHAMPGFFSIHISLHIDSFWLRTINFWFEQDDRNASTILSRFIKKILNKNEGYFTLFLEISRSSL